MSSNTLGNACDWDYDFTVNTPINSAATACAYHTVHTYDQWLRDHHPQWLRDLASIEVAHRMHSPRRRFIVRTPPPYTEADPSPPPTYRRPVFYKVIGRNRSGHPRRIRLN